MRHPKRENARKGALCLAMWRCRQPSSSTYTSTSPPNGNFPLGNVDDLRGCHISEPDGGCERRVREPARKTPLALIYPTPRAWHCLCRASLGPPSRHGGAHAFGQESRTVKPQVHNTVTVAPTTVTQWSDIDEIVRASFSPLFLYIIAVKVSQSLAMVLCSCHSHFFLSPSFLSATVGPYTAHHGQVHGVSSGDISRCHSFCIGGLGSRSTASPDILHQRQAGR
jgi:hypothetical protein